MRTEFTECGDRRTAVKRRPWALTIIKVEGGYRGFESLVDYRIWMGQR